jgi:hypothetical protein
MAVDRTRFSEPTRLALLERFEDRTESWREHVEETVLPSLTSRMDVMAAKLGVYCAIGSCVGGAIVAGIVAVFLK